MPGADDARPIIIIKRRKRGGAAHHGGAWKVAYADFVTAMMAFFLVLWLVSSVSKEQRAAIFDYFKNPSMEPGKSSKAAPGQMGPGGASTSPINLHGGLDALHTSIKREDMLGSPVTPPLPPTALRANESTPIDAEEARKIAEADERKKLEALKADLEQAISKSQALEPFKDQLLLDITPEGLRIQIVDEKNRAMFDLGSSRLKDYTDRILEELAVYLNSVPNRVSITGHTDITPYAGRTDYSNWELSADRANSARRALVHGGLHTEKIARVVGLSSAVLFDKANPSAPINRRISIVVMTKHAEEVALKTDQPPLPHADGTAALPASPTPMPISTAAGG
jgi:chemotaxis protein MotB